METKNWLIVLITALAAVIIQVLTWFALYPLAGYNEWTLLTAQLFFLVLGISILLVFRIDKKQLGASLKNLFVAVIVICSCYGIILIILAAANAFGFAIPIFRQEYQFYAFVNNWLLSGFGEELVFAGIIFNLLVRSFKKQRHWTAILITALIFALWHLPGYVAVGKSLGTLGPNLIVDLLLRMVSWSFFGLIYFFSGNLWLAAFAHASTDYALLPVVINSPVIGLVFMLSIVAAAYWSGGRKIQRPELDAKQAAFEREERSSLAP